MSSIRMTRILWAAAVLVVVICGVIVWRANPAGYHFLRTQDRQPPSIPGIYATDDHAAGTFSAANQPALPQRGGAAADKQTQPPSQDPGDGTGHGVDPHLNPQVASVDAALHAHAGYHLSTLLSPPPFDPASFARDPQAYIHEVIPSRAFQTAAPGAQVPVLVPLGPTHLVLSQDQVAFLRVRGKPGHIVTFTSMDRGSFGDALPSQTVIADSQGMASVAFHAGPGTTDAVHVIAGSPMLSGQVSFFILIAAHYRGCT